MLKHIPNILTVLRFILIPFILTSVFQENYLVAFILFTISGITDVVDGMVARKFNFITTFGKLMDPLADKLTQLAVLASLVIKNLIPIYFLIILLIKELLMIIGSIYLYKKDIVVHSKWYGKLATVVLYISIVLTLLINIYHLDLVFSYINISLYVIFLIITILSLFMYIKDMYIKNIRKVK